MGNRTVTFQQLRDSLALEFGDGYRAKNEELGGEGPIFLRAAYLQESGFNLFNPDRFNMTSIDRFGPKVARKDDVVITTKGNSIGRIGVIRQEQAGSVYSPHLSYWRSLSPDILNQRFLYFWSLSQEFRSQLHRLAYATDMAPYTQGVGCFATRLRFIAGDLDTGYGVFQPKRSRGGGIRSLSQWPLGVESRRYAEELRGLAGTADRINGTSDH